MSGQRPRHKARSDSTVQSAQVFGRVPSQTIPSAGVYTDTVIITVTY
jgi:spore coat protein U-like protein